jgi:hypothetical protein
MEHYAQASPSGSGRTLSKAGMDLFNSGSFRLACSFNASGCAFEDDNLFLVLASTISSWELHSHTMPVIGRPRAGPAKIIRNYLSFSPQCLSLYPRGLPQNRLSIHLHGAANVHIASLAIFSPCGLPVVRSFKKKSPSGKKS